MLQANGHVALKEEPSDVAADAAEAAESGAAPAADEADGEEDMVEPEAKKLKVEVKVSHCQS